MGILEGPDPPQLELHPQQNRSNENERFSYF